MISKIIQKEKERQDINIDLLKVKKELFVYGKRTERDIRELMDINYEHKQSLINLKEYMEELLEMVGFSVIKKSGCEELSRHKFEEDIKELEEMIGRYS